MSDTLHFDLAGVTSGLAPYGVSFDHLWFWGESWFILILFGWSELQKKWMPQSFEFFKNLLKRNYKYGDKWKTLLFLV